MSVSLTRRALAELAGTALLVGIGTGSIVIAVKGGGVPQLWLAAAWFTAVAVPILLFARISGAHLNPVVTLALWLGRRFPAKDVPAYLGAQLIGAFAGSIAVLLSLGSGAHLGATIPSTGNLLLVFVMETSFTCLLVLSVLWLTSDGKVPRSWELMAPPLVVGLSTYFIGPWTGSSLNPARTLAPALLSGDLTALWIYLVAVPAGSIVAVSLLFIFRHLRDLNAREISTA